MSSCDPKALMDAARCFRCIPKGMLGDVMTKLACEWANAAPPVATCTWYAGDGMSPPVDWTSYNNFVDASAAGTQSILWGDLNSWWNDDGSGTYVQFYEVGGKWRVAVFMTGSNVPVFLGGAMDTLGEVVMVFLRGGFVPIGFCFQPGDCFWFAANGPDALALTDYNPYNSLAAAEAAAIANGWPNPYYFWGSGNNFWLSSGPQYAVSIFFSGFGSYIIEIYDETGALVYQNDTGIMTLAAAVANAEASGFLPPEFCTENPETPVFADGAGNYYFLVVDILGNVGTESTLVAGSSIIVLDDGFGGFWQVKVDINGNRYAESHPGPATAAPILMDANGVFWTVIVDTLGNIGATS